MKAYSVVLNRRMSIISIVGLVLVGTGSLLERNKNKKFHKKIGRYLKAFGWIMMNDIPIVRTG